MTRRQDELDRISRELEREGFAVVRNRALFAAEGIGTFDPDRVALLKFDGFEREFVEFMVYIYPLDEVTWQLRFTQHGGPHWTLDTNEPATAVEQAIGALRAHIKPPAGWELAHDWRD